MSQFNMDTIPDADTINKDVQKLWLGHFQLGAVIVQDPLLLEAKYKYGQERTSSIPHYLSAILNEMKFVVKIVAYDRISSFNEVTMLKKIGDGHFILGDTDSYGCSADLLMHIIMKQIPGQTIKIDIQDNNTKYKIMYQFATALKQLHDRNILHRDIKPDNALWDNIGTVPIVNIIDFEIAIEDNGTTTGLEINSFTGTEGYMAPEITKRRYRNEKSIYSKKSDIYALGNVFLQLLLQISDKDMQKSSGVINATIEQAAQFGVDPDIFNLCKRMTDVDLSKRIESLGEVIKELERIFLKQYIFGTKEAINVLINAQKVNNILKRYPRDGVKEACQAIVTIIEENKKLGQDGLDLNRGILNYHNVPLMLANGISDKLGEHRKHKQRSYDASGQE